MAKPQQSRPQRWGAAVAAARTALEEVQAKAQDFDAALSDLRDVKQEYQDWYDNMPESLQSSATGEKLQAITDLDLDSTEIDLSEIESLVDEAEGVDLPLGWGKD